MQRAATTRAGSSFYGVSATRFSCVRYFFFFQAEDGIRDYKVTGVQTCALPICRRRARDRGERGGASALGSRVRGGRGRGGARCRHYRPSPPRNPLTGLSSPERERVG